MKVIPTIYRSFSSAERANHPFGSIFTGCGARSERTRFFSSTSLHFSNKSKTGFIDNVLISFLPPIYPEMVNIKSNKDYHSKFKDSLVNVLNTFCLDNLYTYKLEFLLFVHTNDKSIGVYLYYLKILVLNML